MQFGFEYPHTVQGVVIAVSQGYAGIETHAHLGTVDWRLAEIVLAGIVPLPDGAIRSAEANLLRTSRLYQEVAVWLLSTHSRQIEKQWQQHLAEKPSVAAVRPVAVSLAS